MSEDLIVNVLENDCLYLDIYHSDWLKADLLIGSSSIPLSKIRECEL